VEFGRRPQLASSVSTDPPEPPSSDALASRARLALVKESPVATNTNVVVSDVVHVLPRVAAGDELAVRECVERYGSLIWALARRWSPDPRDVEDAVQEVFVDLWRSAGRYDATRATEAGWVAMVTRRRLIDRMRRRQRAVELEPLPEDFDQADDREIDLDRQVRVEQAHAVLQALPLNQRTMLELSLLHGRTHDEIARETGTPLGTVKSHIRRGLQRARDLLQAAPASRAALEDTSV
jgi:RNA polymerase sigma factor (sigma-70 family)